MALHLQTLKTRSLTAVVFGIVMLAGLFWSQWSFFLLFSIIHFGCWFEYQKLVGLIDGSYQEITPFHKYGVMLAGWGFMLFCTNEAYHIGNLAVNAIGWWLGLILLFVLPVSEILFSKKMVLKNIGYSLLGLVYISLSWGLMINLREPIIRHNHDGDFPTHERAWLIPVIIILCMWVNDTMAYMVGSLIGKTPFSRISPKKTWEGTIGGIILCIGIIVWVFHSFLNWKHLLIITTISAVVGTAGDLLESKLKRMANVKDSGNIMPGHGGFLDRFDSLILATPFVWLYLHFFYG